MNNPRTMRRYHYILRMIRNSTFEDTPLLEAFFSEDPDKGNSLFYLIRQACICGDHTDPQLNDQKAYRILIEAVAEYLYAFSTSTTIKRKLYSRIYAWCAHMGVQYCIDGYETCLEEIPNQIATDLSVELVKELHNREGVSKLDLRDKYGVSEKTIQVYLSKLANKSCADPLRIGGQAIYVPVTHKEEKLRTDKRRYFTPHTMSPVILQMNIMQVASLLQSLQMNYDSGNNIPLDIAVDAWSQLSDYAKERIREIFCKRDQRFSDFIDIVDEAEHSETYRFITESEMMKRGEASWHEMLDMAYKGGGVYNITLANPLRSWRRQRVVYDHDRHLFYALPVDNTSSDRLYFSVDEVIDISES